MTFQFDRAALQEMLAALGYYGGAVDGIDGPKTQAGVAIVLANAGLTEVTAGWPAARREVAAMQRILNAQGHEAGAVDGWLGHNTHEALIAWRSARAGTSAAVQRVPAAARGQIDRADLPRQADCRAFYGDPDKDGVRPHLALFDLPVTLRLDYSLRQTVRRVTLHEKCGPAFVTAIGEVAAHYGMERMRDLGIDRYAGGHNHRRMRGGSSWSMHAYGCAVDFYAAPNGLRTRCPAALFCGPDYEPFLDIMESHGWLPALRLWGADAMHFQMARL